MTDLVDMMRYPAVPGFKERTTSREAAQKIAPISGNLRDQVYSAIRARAGGCTADEVAALLERSEFSIRPRLSELRRNGKIRDSDVRRRNESGASAIVWVAT